MLCIMDNSDVSDKVLRTQSVKITKKSFCVSISNAYAFRLTVSGNKNQPLLSSSKHTEDNNHSFDSILLKSN